MTNKIFGGFARTALAVAMLAGTQIASASVLTKTANYVGNTTWQDIVSTSYTWADTNGDSKVTVGEEVTFSVKMHKKMDGRHDFDGLKFWFGDGTSATAQWGEWIRKNTDHAQPDSVVNLNKTFEFKKTFANALTYDIFASVTCDFDLSDLRGDPNVVTAADWKAWTTSYHSDNKYRQGETERYSFAVTAVPEPETYAMMLAGLGLMGTIARRRKNKSA